MRAAPVSCFIIAMNEGDRIARTIRSVKDWVDEVIVVDSESTDDTAEVARAEGCKVITQPWLGFGAQKRFAEDQCRNPWVFNLDADEVVTPELRDAIIALFQGSGPEQVAYGMPVALVYPGDDKPRPFARDHWYVRLYDRRLVRFRNAYVHDTVVTRGFKVGGLIPPVYHHSFRCFADLDRKFSERMPLFAEHGTMATEWMLMLRMGVEFPLNFFKYYVGRRHITGGWKGLRYAWVVASYRHLKVVHMWRGHTSKASSTRGLPYPAE
jgi:glycosyltransferase involved in cell wall biosynthesis